METANRVSEIRILCYSSLYLPVSMALLPVNLYILPFMQNWNSPLCNECHFCGAPVRCYY